MSSAEYLREFVNERLTAAAEEIFSVFKTTIVQYEQEIDRQRKLLDIVWKPEVKLQRIEIPQHHVCKEEEVHAEQQLSNKDCNSSVIQKDPEPPEIKEEQEELFTSQEGEQVALNQETHSFLVTPTHEESDDCETEPESNHQPLSHSSHVTETQDGIGGKHQDSGSKGDAESKSKQRGIDNNKVKNPEQVKISLETCTGERPFKCGTCGETFKKKGSLRRHWRVHTGEKPYSCDTCGKHYRDGAAFRLHLKVHTGEKTHTCSTCNKAFSSSSCLKTHMRRHTGEKPYACNTCGKDFMRGYELRRHMKTHTGERPYSCAICGKGFISKQTLKGHYTIHTGVTPHTCQICGKKYVGKATLKKHMDLHTREKNKKK